MWIRDNSFFRMEVSMRFRSWLMFLFVAVLISWQTLPAAAQSLTSGDAAGTITDPSGAVVPNATVTLKSNDTGALQTRTSNAQGAYRFSLLGLAPTPFL
jgi:carboxypeptidase family protein